MKYAFFYFVFFLSTQVSAQDVYLKLKSGKTIESKVNVISDSQLFTANGTYKYSEIDSVGFPNIKKADMDRADEIVHRFHYFNDNTYKRSEHLTKHEKTLIINSKTLNKGIYVNFQEFKYNKPSLELTHEVYEKINDFKESGFIGREQYEITYYKLRIDVKEGKKAGKIFGFCDGKNIYVKLGTGKLSPNSNFVPIEFSGRYCFFENIVGGTMYYGENTSFSPRAYSWAVYLIEIKSGNIRPLTKVTLKNILRDDQEILRRYLDDHGEDVEREYFFEFIDKYSSD